jgi:hypothetical protein
MNHIIRTAIVISTALVSHPAIAQSNPVYRENNCYQNGEQRLCYTFTWPNGTISSGILPKGS